MYEPLVLTTDRTRKDRKAGTVVTHYSDGDGIDGTLHTVTTYHKDAGRRGRDRYAVYVDRRLAGVLYVEGIGRWSVHSYGADSKPFRHFRADGSEYQPRGYDETGTLARNVERIAFEYLNAVDYANRKVES